ncbi:MAG: response regulator [Psychrobium sp.]
MKRVLLVEDDKRLAALVDQFLTQNGFVVTVIDRGDMVADFLKQQALKQQTPDLIILDIMLPGSDGFTIIKQIRHSFHNPILFLTAKDSDFDHVTGLELGADDYIIKPVEPHVLLARVNNALRRAAPSPQANGQDNSQERTFGQLHINNSMRTVNLGGENIVLTSHEFELLWLLANKAGEVQSRDFIHKEMIGREYDGFDRSVDVRVSRLRKKLHDDLSAPTRIITVWGKGYIFSPTAWD